MWCIKEEWGVAGGVEAWLKTQDQMQWDGHGSPSGAVDKKWHPVPTTLLWLIYKLIWLCYVFVYVYVCVYMFTGCLEE